MTISYRAARRAYELGRFRVALVRALWVALPVAVWGVFTSGRAGLLVLPLTFTAWAFLHFRGDELLRGAWYGLLGGLATSVLPMSVLRPCCDMTAAAGANCCTMPGACLGAGALVGMLLAAAVPFGRAAWWRTALGIALGMASIAVLKCATLFAGEAVGLAGGLAAGVAVMAGAKVALAGRMRRES
ncbi:MAG TPA: hypothetical protein VER12_20425 [Polyangiaceae bacterium]|nr:hypothetical protein [Polyangiaceae bacterium]